MQVGDIVEYLYAAEDKRMLITDMTEKSVFIRHANLDSWTGDWCSKADVSFPLKKHRAGTRVEK